MKNKIYINSIGYLPSQQKIASLFMADSENDLNEFFIINKENNKLYNGKISKTSNKNQHGEILYLADFSDFSKCGEFKILVENFSCSTNFIIDPKIYNNSLKLNMISFYGLRCGEPISFEYKGEQFSKDQCHIEDGYLDYYNGSTGQTKDGTGGWHDAGDYGKYVVNAAFSNGIMFTAWNHYKTQLENFKVGLTAFDSNIPDYLAEIKYNNDWLFKMQFEDGKVSHKLTRLTFSSLNTKASDDTEKRYFSPWGSEATACFVAVMSQAARIFKDILPEYSEKCLEAAKKSFNVIYKQKYVKTDQSMFNTGQYQLEKHTDYDWAIIEYAITTRNDDLLNEISKNISEGIYSFDVDWDWGESKNIGLYSLLSNKHLLHKNDYNILKNSLLSASDKIITNSLCHNFNRGLKDYYWGCNGAIARTTLNLMSAYRLTDNIKYKECALNQLSYLYGVNPYGRSFITGEGFNPPKNIHHRPSVSDNRDNPWPGYLAGGSHPTEFDWKDIESDASVNENAINWNASLSYALAAFYKN